MKKKDYLIWILPIFVIVLLGMYACENTRQSVGVTTNPFSTKFEEKTKLQWKITFGKIRPKEDTDED
tara:strand:+ start:590 stop:790 length:201 start_codon:yes stop_codon:yes gene_type:complete